MPSRSDQPDRGDHTTRRNPAFRRRDGSAARTKTKTCDEEDNRHLVDLLKTEEAGYLVAEGAERTQEFSQEEVVQNVPLQAAKKRFDLRLEQGGRYTCSYSRDGRNLLLAGRRGHVAALEWERGRLLCELELDEVVRAVTWMQSDNFFAVAQQRYVYVYDSNGAEVHRLTQHTEIDHLDYLPFHFLLCSIGAQGTLRYQDITHGQIVAELATKMGRCRSMRQNPSTGVMHLGHSGGLVTLWSPAVSGPLATMQCHASPIDALAIDPQGLYMATAGLDGHLRVWDLRTWRKLHEYNTPSPSVSLDISQRGMLAAAHGSHVSVWKDCLGVKARAPYLHHHESGLVANCVRFCPFDDILGIGSSRGFSSILVPGAGEPNYDSYEVNPMASRSQQREGQVKQLLDKLPPETIMLDPSLIGVVARTEEERHALKADIEHAARNPDGSKRQKKPRTHQRKADLEREKRRRNIIDEETMRQREIIINTAKSGSDDKREKKTALDRFKLKSL